MTCMETDKASLGDFVFRQETDHKCLFIHLFYILESLLDRSNTHLLSIDFNI